jgi:hypothetical protein
MTTDGLNLEMRELMLKWSVPRDPKASNEEMIRQKCSRMAKGVSDTVYIDYYTSKNN